MTDAVARARKLLELERRTNYPAEAQAAARALAKLLERERISVAELELSGERSADGLVVADDPLLRWRRLVAWRRDLADILCHHHGVAWWQRNWPDGAAAVMMCGRADDIALVRSMYDWLAEETMHLCRISCEGQDQRYRRGWRIGFVGGIAAQLKEAREQVAAEAQSDGRQQAALAVRDRASAAQEHLETVLGKMPVKDWTGKDPELGAYLSGSKRGRQIHLGGRIGDLDEDDTGTGR